MTEQRWYDYGDFEETELGWTLRSGDRVWLATAWTEPGDPVGQDHLYLCRGDAPGEWGASYDPIEGRTPVWGSLSEAWTFINSERGLPGGAERWMPITAGDRWRHSEGKKPRRAASRDTIAAIAAHTRENDK